MNKETSPRNGKQVELRRYPNRRYYDCARSQHLTLEDIYRLVRDGYNVRASDSKTGDDITVKLLAQLILEHDPPKLAAFPVELLHQIIRSNESLLRDFVEKYFNGALTAFPRIAARVRSVFRTNAWPLRSASRRAKLGGGDDEAVPANFPYRRTCKRSLGSGCYHNSPGERPKNNR